MSLDHLAHANLIRVFDFYLAAMFVLSIYRRFSVYIDTVQLAISLRTKYPKLASLLKNHKNLFLSGDVLRPTAVVACLLATQFLLSRVVYPQATITVGGVTEVWWRVLSLACSALPMVAVGLLFFSACGANRPASCRAVSRAGRTLAEIVERPAHQNSRVRVPEPARNGQLGGAKGHVTIEPDNATHLLVDRAAGRLPHGLRVDDLGAVVVEVEKQVSHWNTQVVQSSVRKPGTRLKSRLLRVSKTRPRDNAIAAIRKSMTATFNVPLKVARVADASASNGRRGDDSIPLTMRASNS